MGAAGTTHKHWNGRTEDDTVRNKQRFIDALAKGMQAALAAKKCKLGYSTVYDWKANDPEFAKAWVEACELGLDKIEYDTYASGLSADRQFILKARRREVFGPHLDEQRTASSTNFLLQIAEQEHRVRLQRLGLAAPDDVIEGDYEEIDAAVPTPSGGGTSSDS